MSNSTPNRAVGTVSDIPPSRSQWLPAMRTEEPALTEQFYVTLRTNLDQLRRNTQRLRGESDATLTAAEKILSTTPRSWEAAYEVERLLVDLYDGPMLDVELQRRLVEAERSLFPNEFAFYSDAVAGLDNSDGADDQRRALLGRLTNDLQWRYSVNEARRNHIALVTSKTCSLFFIVAIAFLLTLLLLGSGYEYAIGPLIAPITGAWGACFSLLVGLRDQLDRSNFDELKVMDRWGYLLSRPVIGAGGALVFYFFLEADLLEGPMFPAMDDLDLGSVELATDGAALSLLVVWSFIAGFSEKLVPTILARTGKQVEAPQMPVSTPPPVALSSGLRRVEDRTTLANAQATLGPQPDEHGTAPDSQQKR